MHRFKRFLGVGAIGFLVDFGMLAFCLEVFGLPPIPARLVAFAVAILSTWILNRTLTFRDRRSRGLKSELMRYASASAAASLANLSIYALVVSLFDGSAVAPYVALPIGVLAGLAINYWLYSKFVFKAQGG